MIVCDTGPLIAILDRNDPDHDRCVDALRLIDVPLHTTWLCLTEAMHLLSREVGWAGRQKLWDFILRGDIVIDRLISVDSERIMSDLMTTSSDAPMDIADASVVLLASTLRTRRIFTIDRHFRAFQALDGNPFELIPEDN